ncbi:MAG: transposase, partial [Chromatiales bacterium]
DKRGQKGDLDVPFCILSITTRLSFVDRNLTNAVGEGLNRIVKIVKNRASGYRNLESFADMIYLTIGDLDVPAQIPSHLRTL